MRETSDRTVITVMMLAVLGYLSVSVVVYGSIPGLFRIFTPPEMVVWVQAGYYVVAGTAAAICGSIGDRYGRRRVLLAVMAIAAVGGLFSAFAPSLSWMIAGHAVQGVAMSIPPLCIGILRERLSPRKVPLAVGIVTSLIIGSVAFLFMVSGFILDVLSWPWIFGVGVIVLCIGMPAVMLFIPPIEFERVERKIDWMSGVLFAIGIFAVLLALTQGKTWGWLSAEILAVAAGGIACLAGWVFWSLRTASPLIDVRLLKRRQIGLTMIAYALAALGAVQIGTILLILFQMPASTGTGFGLTGAQPGAMLIPFSVVAVAAAISAGHLAGRFGARQVLIGLLSISLAGWVGLFFCHDSLPVVVALTVPLGIANGAAFPTIANLIVEDTAPSRLSEVSGMGEVVRGAFSAIGIQFITLCLSSAVHEVPGPTGLFPQDSALRMAFLYVIATVLITLLVALALAKRPPLSHQG